MRVRWVLGVLVLAWTVSDLHGQLSLPEQKRGSVVARLNLRIDKASTPGLAEMTYTLEVEGGLTLEVERASLSDALAAWQSSSRRFCRLKAGRLTLTEVLDLRQTKPGFVAAPAVKVRFREGPDAAWQEAEWVDILKLNDKLTPDPPPPAPARLSAWWFAIAAGGSVVLVVLGLLAWLGLRPRPPRQPSAEEVVLQELTRMGAVAASRNSEWYHTRLSFLVRRFLADKFALQAPQQTTAEFLEAVRQVPNLTNEQQALLREFLERCDLGKFAPVSASAEECRQSTLLARALVEQLAKAGPAVGTSANKGTGV